MTDETKPKQETDYLGRLNRLTEAESKEWLSLAAGKQHVLEFLSEGTPFEQEWRDKDGNEETVHKLRFDVRTDGKEYSFSVTEGTTTQSLYGQLMLIAAKTKPENTMIGKKVTIIVTGEGKKKRYTVLEAVGLDKPATPEVKEVVM